MRHNGAIVERSAPLGELLVSKGLVRPADLDRALERQSESGDFLGETLVSLGYVQPTQLRPILEELTGFATVDLSQRKIDPAVASRITEMEAQSMHAIPFAERGEVVLVGMADPVNLNTIEQLQTKLGKHVEPYLAFEYDISDAIRRTFDVRNKTRSLLEQIGQGEGGGAGEEGDLTAEAEQAPIVRLIAEILEGAVDSGASDVHFEPQEQNVRIRYRIDGILYEQMTIPSTHLSPCISRIKVMASLDISERRRPQDGRFTFLTSDDKTYDVRLSIMPTVHGEKACMRMLEKSSSIAVLDKLGLTQAQQATFASFIKRPHGLLLVTGPTGCGKTTTLYAALQHINSPTINISSIEDPVEYKLPGVNQMQVNPKIGVVFAGGLRTLVRQDPDVIMVGEIRDRETAEMAIQAALAGRLVLTSLHTNGAPGALVRLANMGVEPFLISSTVIGVIGQRLVRTNCPFCSEPPPHAEDVARSLRLDEALGKKFMHGIGCARCGNRGTRGRTAAMEIMPMTDELRAMVLHTCSEVELTEQARKEGMVTMKEAALEKAYKGLVSPEEVIRVFSEELD